MRSTFQCENCGSPDYYEDGSGTLVCSMCFSQSQTQAYSQEAHMDFDDIMAVAARTRTGHIMKAKTNNVTSSRSRAKQPLEVHDKSQPLPDLKACLSGFQQVLKGAVLRTATILGFNAEEREILMDTVKKIWMAYLQTWKDGAEVYGIAFPDLRFSLRDAFLNEIQKGALARVLSAKVAKEVYEELGEGEKSPINEVGASDQGNHNQSTMHSGSVSANKSHGAHEVKPITSMRQLSEKLLNKGKYEAAISLTPSMEFAAAIIWLGISRIGVTPGQLIHWIANGSLPLLNAYQLLLSPDHQHNLKSIRSFFRMQSLPSPSLIEKYGALLAITCGLQSTAQIPQLADMEDAKKDDEEGQRGEEEMLESTAESNLKVLQRIRFVSTECVPLMIGQLIADLRLGQTVLDIALALIGHPPRRKAGQAPLRLPPPLKRAQPSKISNTESALAVITVACKMCAGWENWYYIRGPQTPSSAVGTHQDSCSTPFNTDGQVAPKATQHIPWNEEQFGLLRNEHVSSYLDFIETITQQKADTTSDFDSFTCLIDEYCEEKEKALDSGRHRFDTASNGRGRVVLDVASNMHHKELLNRGSKGFSPYLSYPDSNSHTEAKRASPEPFHRCYSRLLEYIAYKTHTDVARIHAIVASLDEEVKALCDNRGEFDDPKEKMEKKNRLIRHRDAERRRRKRQHQSEANISPPPGLSIPESSCEERAKKIATRKSKKRAKNRIRILKRIKALQFAPEHSLSNIEQEEGVATTANLPETHTTITAPQLEEEQPRRIVPPQHNMEPEDASFQKRGIL